MDRKSDADRASLAGEISRAIAFGAAVAVAVGIVLLPYWVQLIHNPIRQMPIPHASRDNYLLIPSSGLNFWIIPMAGLILVLPFIFWRGTADRRLRPLFFGFFLTMILGTGGTTPVARILLDRAFYVLTFERFTFWATLMALPFAGLFAAELIDRFGRKIVPVLWIVAVGSCAMAVSWTYYRPITVSPFKVDQVISFLNRDDHSKFRYITLGFGNQFSKVATYTDATSVDGDYNSARLLPELTEYGAGQLFSAKFFGLAGMESLRIVLKHANQYGLKYVFVRDRYYEPLLAFAGWREAESYDNGNVTLWAKDDVPPAHAAESSALMPTAWESLMWGILPVGSSLLAILLVVAMPERRRVTQPIEFPAPAGSVLDLREAK